MGCNVLLEDCIQVGDWALLVLQGWGGGDRGADQGQTYKHVLYALHGTLTLSMQH